MKRSALIAGVMLTAGIAAAAYFSASLPVSSAASGSVSDAGRVVLYYRCPMHPSYTSDKPGRAADCGMEMVPVYGDRLSSGASTSAGDIRVTAEQQQLMGVSLAPVMREAGTRMIRTIGRVVVDESRDFPVVAGADGWVRGVEASATTGRLVRKGDALATLTGREFTTPQRNFLYALRAPETIPGADLQTDGFEERTALIVDEARLDLEKLGFIPEEIDEIAASRQVRLDVTLRAPATGLLLARHVYPGTLFTQGTELFRIADVSSVWILADVTADDARHLTPGTRVEIAVPDQASTTQAVVSDAVPAFDSVTRTLQVRLAARNPDLRLRPEMIVDVHLQVAFPEALTVPSTAVIDTGLHRMVFVEKEAGMFSPREVEIGWQSGDRVQVVTGLTEGERVAATGAFLFDSETRLNRGVPHQP